MFAKFESALQSHGYPHPVTFLFAYGITKWMHDKQIDDPDFQKFPSHLRPMISKAFREQALIGWQQGVKGLYGKAWYELATSQLFGQGTTDTIIGETRIRRLSAAIFTLVNDLWKARNKVLHDQNEMQCMAIRSKECADIEYYHSHPELLCPGDRHYCLRSLSKILSSRHSVRRRWLQYVKRSRHQQLRDGTTQTTITQFMTPH